MESRIALARKSLAKVAWQYNLARRHYEDAFRDIQFWAERLEGAKAELNRQVANFSGDR